MRACKIGYVEGGGERLRAAAAPSMCRAFACCTCSLASKSLNLTRTASGSRACARSVGNYVALPACRLNNAWSASAAHTSRSVKCNRPGRMNSPAGAVEGSTRATPCMTMRAGPPSTLRNAKRRQRWHARQARVGRDNRRAAGLTRHHPIRCGWMMATDYRQPQRALRLGTATALRHRWKWRPRGCQPASRTAQSRSRWGVVRPCRQLGTYLQRGTSLSWVLVHAHAPARVIEIHHAHRGPHDPRFSTCIRVSFQCSEQGMLRERAARGSAEACGAAARQRGAHT